AVAVGVEPGDAEAVAAVGVGDAHLLAGFGEAAVAVVSVEEVAAARQAARSALHGDAAELAGLVFAELGQLVEVDLDVAADEEVEIAVAVVVREAAAGGPAAALDAGRRGDVGEGAVAAVPVEVVGAQRGDVEVLPAVAVDVGDAGAHAPAGVSDAGLDRDVDEAAVAEVAVERAGRRRRLLRGVDGER